MKYWAQDKGFEVTRWYASKTLDQQFADGVSFDTSQEIICQPFFKFSIDSSRKIAMARLEWRYTLKNFVEYIADDHYYVDYSNLDDASIKINSLIVISYAKFLQEFDRRMKVIHFKEITHFDKAKIDELYQKILSLLGKRA